VLETDLSFSAVLWTDYQHPQQLQTFIVTVYNGSPGSPVQFEFKNAWVQQLQIVDAGQVGKVVLEGDTLIETY
jgi:hypothetical protein